MDKAQTCPVCKNPRKSDGSGSLTQWIVTCECDLKALRESAQGLTSSVCTRCGKRTREALPGSFSQFIFSSDCCSCSQEELQRHVDAGAIDADPDTRLKTQSTPAGRKLFRDEQSEFEQDGLDNFGSSTNDGLRGADDELSGADGSKLKQSSVLTSIQKSILEAADAQQAEPKRQPATGVLLLAGLVVVAVFAIGFSMTSGLFRAPERNVATQKIAPPDETLSDRMRLYEDEKWTLLAQDGVPFYDGGPEIVEEDFGVLNQYKNVRSLRLLRSEKITGAGFALVRDKRIGAINLNSREFTDEGMTELARFKGLQLLTLGFFYKVTDAGMSRLETLPVLKQLVFNHARLPDHTLSTVIKIKSLHEVGFAVCENLKHEQLSQLSKLPNLQKVRLCTQDITNADCLTISRLSNLQELDLINNKISTTGVEHLVKLPLTRLTLSGNPISDKALNALSRVKTLKLLMVANCPQLTEEAKIAFQKALPKCQLLETVSDTQ
ncbi:MAG: hypothetical protein SGJ27_02315 [Candidatus Melainabacteria bacterium]|nr:hypothetical protein [Candidatus Melainabacteria bacterium]